MQKTRRVIARHQLPVRMPWGLTAVVMLVFDEAQRTLREAFGYRLPLWVWGLLVATLVLTWVGAILQAREEEQVVLNLGPVRETS